MRNEVADKMFATILKGESPEYVSKLICETLMREPELMHGVVDRLASTRGFRVELGNLMLDPDFCEWVEKAAKKRKLDAHETKSFQYFVEHTGGDLEVKEWLYLYNLRTGNTISRQYAGDVLKLLDRKKKDGKLGAPKGNQNRKKQ